MREGNIFSLSTLAGGGVSHPRSGRGGVPYPRSGSQVWTRGGGVPHPRFGWGVPWGTPLAKSGWWGVPPRSGWWEGGNPGYPPGQVWMVPPPPARSGWWGVPREPPHPHYSSIASTCYPAGGVPLAFTQEDFLVLNGWRDKTYHTR